MTDKAVARGLRNDTVPFIRHALLRATARARLAGAPLVALSVDPWNEPDSDAEEDAAGIVSYLPREGHVHVCVLTF